MKTLIQGDLSEISPDFWAKQQAIYAGRQVRVKIQIETEDASVDETERILRNPKLKLELENAMQDVKQYLNGQTTGMISFQDTEALNREIQDRLASQRP